MKVFMLGNLQVKDTELNMVWHCLKEKRQEVCGSRCSMQDAEYSTRGVKIFRRYVGSTVGELHLEGLRRRASSRQGKTVRIAGPRKWRAGLPKDTQLTKAV